MELVDESPTPNEDAPKSEVAPRGMLGPTWVDARAVGLLAVGGCSFPIGLLSTL